MRRKGISVGDFVGDVSSALYDMGLFGWKRLARGLGDVFADHQRAMHGRGQCVVCAQPYPCATVENIAVGLGVDPGRYEGGEPPAVGPEQATDAVDDAVEALAVLLSQQRTHGSVFMDGGHNPTPGDILDARQFIEDLVESGWVCRRAVVDDV